MSSIALPLFVYYLAVLAVFCGYGLHRYGQVWTFLRHGGLKRRDPDPAPFATLPRVTVQLPMFNEQRVAERIIRAACAIDYPRERLQVQVLDDSTDASAEIARRCCERMRAAGHDVEYRHRRDRGGYKAGALAAGMASATGEFVAIFDADFVPPADILHRTIHQFTDDRVGMVQTRWTHLNRDESLLTQIQAMCLDGHFVVEQTARARSGRWFNFNGTAGVWRSSCIEDAGGWEHDTLTEDTDLSYRAQARGWRFVYLPHVTCPAELPPTVGALMTQQHRWSKGLVQNAIKLLPGILRGPAPLATKIEAWFHLTAPLPYAALLLLTLLIAPAFAVPMPSTAVGGGLALGLGLACLGLGTMAACTFYVVSQRALRQPVGPAILRLLPLMAVGIGVSPINTRALVEALAGKRSPFVRTPKFAGAEVGDADPSLHQRRRLPAGTVEVALGGLMVVCGLLTFTEPAALVGLPFIALFASGYLGVGIPRMLCALGLSRRALRSAPLRPVAAGGSGS